MEDQLRSGGGVLVELADDAPMADGPPADGEGEAYSYVGPGGKDKRAIIYPLYLNSKKTVQQGRKVPADIAVENPLAQEIHEVCAQLELRAVMEPIKTHPRDWGKFGRVRVELLDALTNEPLNAQVTTRKQLLREIARRIPRLQSRVNPPKQTHLTIQQQLGLEPIPAHLLAQMQAAHAGPMPPQAAPAPHRSGKKGRKKG